MYYKMSSYPYVWLLYGVPYVWLLYGVKTKVADNSLKSLTVKQLNFKKKKFLLMNDIS